METKAETLEKSQVRLHVTVPADEFDQAVDAAFHKLARNVKIPGFRPGKAPRQLLEAQFGNGAARQQALDDALPTYLARAAEAEKLDVVALVEDPREHVVSGEEEGDVTFETIVEVRPEVTLKGYDSLTVELADLEVTDEQVNEQLEQLRERFADLEDSTTPLSQGNYATIDIAGSRNGEQIDGLTATDFLYEVGGNTIVPELDTQLIGKKPGDVLEFSANVAAPNESEELTQFRVLVKETKRKVLPELTPSWVTEVSEFETIDALKEDIRKRMQVIGRMRAQMNVREKVLDAVSDLVHTDIPEGLINQQIRRRLEDMVRELSEQQATLTQYLAAINKTQEELLAELREPAVRSAQADLALRAVVAQEAIEATDEEVTAELERLAPTVGQKPDKLRKDLERRGGLDALRSDIAMGKALRFLTEHASVVDQQGNPVDLTLGEEIADKTGSTESTD